MDNDGIRDQVRDFYGEIALKKGRQEQASCCSCASCDSPVANAGLLYENGNLAGLPEEAVSSSLGCANPLVVARLQPGEVVLDLGSGGGLDVLAASKYVGPDGKVYGLDMTDEMLDLASRNKKRMGVANVEFLKGYIEDIPLPDGAVDVVMSNCVINLSPDKSQALAEAYRVLKESGRLAIADIVSLREVPPAIRQQVGLWCGCLAGTLEIDDYRQALAGAGFQNIEIEPVHVYTKDLILQMFPEAGKMFDDRDLDAISGLFAGALIRAGK